MGVVYKTAYVDVDWTRTMYYGNTSVSKYTYGSEYTFYNVNQNDDVRISPGWTPIGDFSTTHYGAGGTTKYTTFRFANSSLVKSSSKYISWYYYCPSGATWTQSLPISVKMASPTEYRAITLSMTASYSETQYSMSITMPTVAEYQNAGGPIPDGYSLTGWKSDGWSTQFAPGDVVTRSGSGYVGEDTWYPVYSPKSYTIELYDNVSSTKWDSVSVTYGKYCSNLANKIPTTKIGYKFVSWNTEPDGTGATYTSSTTYAIVGNLKLYAQWTINTYTLTANANGGSILATEGWTGTGSSATKNIVYNGEYGLLPIAEKTGYLFGGWYTAATGGSPVTSETKMGAASIPIYAHWVEGIKVIFDLQGGTKDGDPFPEETSGGHIVKIYRIMENNTASYSVMEPPIRENYFFEGYYAAPQIGGNWNAGTRVYKYENLTRISADTTATSYWNSNSQWVYKPATGVQVITLYAHWRRANVFMYDGTKWLPLRNLYSNISGTKKIKSWSMYDGTNWVPERKV